MTSSPSTRSEREIEFLQKLVERRTEDLKFADAKAGVILTLAVALAAGALTAAANFAQPPSDKVEVRVQYPNLPAASPQHTAPVTAASTGGQPAPVDVTRSPQPRSSRTLDVVAGLLICAACLAAFGAIKNAVRAVRPRRDGAPELPGTVVFAGGYNKVAGVSLAGAEVDLMSAAGSAGLHSDDYLRQLGLMTEPMAQLLAKSALRMAGITYLKYRYISAASTWVGIEAFLLLLAGTVQAIFPLFQA